MTQKTAKPYWEMNQAELQAATRQFDVISPGVPGRPLTAADRRRHAKARRAGRPKIGLGAEKVRVSIERGLLNQVDVLATHLHTTRSDLVARGLRAVLAVQ